MEAEQAVDPRRALRRLRLVALTWIVLCLFFLGYGASLVWKSERGLPAAYAALRARGIAATANLVRCAPGVGGGRGVGCRLRIDYQGHSRTWDYPEDAGQFESLQPGAPIAVLVDPRDATTVYTVHDVDKETNTGVTSPVLWYGIVLIAVGIASLAGLLWIVRGRRPRFGGESR